MNARAHAPRDGDCHEYEKEVVVTKYLVGLMRGDGSNVVQYMTPDVVIVDNETVVTEDERTTGRDGVRKDFEKIATKIDITYVESAAATQGIHHRRTGQLTVDVPVDLRCLNESGRPFGEATRVKIRQTYSFRRVNGECLISRIVITYPKEEMKEACPRLYPSD